MQDLKGDLGLQLAQQRIRDSTRKRPGRASRTRRRRRRRPSGRRRPPGDRSGSPRGDGRACTFPSTDPGSPRERAAAPRTMRMIGVMARRISSPVIVGRDSELEQLRAAVARGTAGDTPTAVISGEAGVGKSRLVAELAAARAELGVSVVVGGCPAVVDTPLPYAPIVAAIEALLRDADEGDITTLLDGIGADLLRIVPGLAPQLADARPVNVPDAMIPGRVFDAVRTLLQRAAARSRWSSCSRTSTGPTPPRST